MVAGAGNLADWSDVAYGAAPPSVRLVVPNSTLQTIPHNTATPISFPTGSEVLDPFDWHNETTNPTRITPQVAGWYDVWGAVAFAGRNDWSTMYAFIRQNGTTALAPAWKPQITAGSQVSSTVMGTVNPLVVFLNGSSDYVEICAQHTNTAAAAGSTAASFQFSSTFELKYRMKS